jgi:hypothetical protein
MKIAEIFLIVLLMGSKCLIEAWWKLNKPSYFPGRY